MQRRERRGPQSVTGLLSLLIVLLFAPVSGAEWIDLGGDELQVDLIESDGLRTVYEIRIGGFEVEPLLIDGKTWYAPSLPGEGVQLEAGLPALPDLRRAFIIPDAMEVAAVILEAESVDLADMPVLPSKGNLPRSVDPSSVPYRFDSFYQSDGIWPTERVVLEDPHILRDWRGVLVDANCFQYLPAIETLRVTTRLRIEIVPVGPGRINVLHRAGPPEKVDPQFSGIYERHFLNYRSMLDRYTPVLEEGGILIIAYDAFYSTMDPLLEWKLSKGIDTQLVSTSETGGTAAQILAFIQNEYNTSDLCYVLLVGDGAQIPIPSGGSDPMYSLLAGGDNYPDIFVGRFSAENASQAATQVERTIQYERDVNQGEIWPQYGTGVASNQGPGDDGEYDNEHMDVIRQKLLNYGYIEVDQIYDPTGTAAMVAAALNEGRGIVNYCGHGSTTSWGTTGFSNTHVNALTNHNMLPFILSVACNNGTFTGTTCFAEAWLRATNGGVPTGAIACYMSYISQSWNPPMCAEDEAIDLLVGDEMRTIGGLWFNGSCQMMDEYGSEGVTEFKNWTIFGDPSLAVRTKQAQLMAVDHTGVLLIGMDEYDVSIPGLEGALCALYADGVLYGSARTNSAGAVLIYMSAPPVEPMTLTLTVTAYNKVTFIEPVEVLPPSGPYLVYESVEVLDPAGDHDGMLDEGESVELEVTIENVGVDSVTGVSAQLFTADAYVSILDGLADYPDIPPGGFSAGLEPFSLEVAGDVPDDHLIQFDVIVNSIEGSWDMSFTLEAQAPVLAESGCIVVDLIGGNGSGTADAGETFTLRVKLSNSGQSASPTLTGMLGCADWGVIVHDAYGDCAEIPVDGMGTMTDFEVEILPGFPEPGMLEFMLDVDGANGFACDLIFELPVGGWFDDFETDRGWTAGAPGDNASLGLWTRVDPNGTTYNGQQCQPEDDHTLAPGVMCFVTGQGSIGGTAGENDVDSGVTTLLSPVFHLDGAVSALFSYWRWYTNDLGNNPGEDYWNVDVTSDGVNWVSLEHTLASANEWTQMSFNLADYIELSDQVQLRFVASDLVNGSLVEAAVDDVLLDASWTIQTAVEDGTAPAKLALGSNFPNPFNPKTTLRFDLPMKGLVDFAVYDVTGRRVRTLVSEVMEAGTFELIWDGSDGEGHQVASGLYFSRLAFGGEVLTGKMLMLK